MTGFSPGARVWAVQRLDLITSDDWRTVGAGERGTVADDPRPDGSMMVQFDGGILLGVEPCLLAAVPETVERSAA